MRLEEFLQPTAIKTAGNIANSLRLEDFFNGKDKIVPAVKESLTKPIGGDMASILSNYATKPEVQKDVAFNAVLSNPVGNALGMMAMSPMMGYQAGQEAKRLQEGQSMFGNAEIDRLKNEAMKFNPREFAVNNPITTATMVAGPMAGMMKRLNIAPKDLIEKQGLKYLGVQKGSERLNIPDSVMFNNPKTDSTIMIPVNEVTPERIKVKILEDNKAFGVKEKQSISKDIQPLYEEAKKYKTAEEFVNSKLNSLKNGFGYFIDERRKKIWTSERIASEYGWKRVINEPITTETYYKASPLIVDGYKKHNFPKGEHVYHYTLQERLKNIQKEGIVPNKRGGLSRSGDSGNNIYAFESANQEYFKNGVERDIVGNDTSSSAILRFKKNVKWIKDNDFIDDTPAMKSNQKISPQDIEIFTEKGWTPLVDIKITKINGETIGKSQLTDIWNKANKK
jgi:hypothetical protein